ncbi:hypothetical protein OIU84_009371 [Salix udensis]|uniref:EF-hand domain-containing protein n=1 Tax=Salix udensis TaxID=889485 RepID=A0AAD6JRI3_9ROSI|nr:hypothetical protein OIU84_009371 [Salix udensis]
MASGLKRDPIVILRIDGEDLLEFINGPDYEAEMALLFSQLESPDGSSLRDHIVKVLEQLTVDQGMPPSSESWVKSNLVERTLQSCTVQDHDKPLSQETFLVEFKKVAGSVAQHLKEQPVIVAHYKTLNTAMEIAPKDRNGKISKEYLRVALDAIAPSAGLPPIGAIHEMDEVIGEVLKMMNADDGKLVKEDEFKKMLTEIMGTIMLQLECNPVSISSNTVVHEPLASSTTLLPPSS